MNENSSRPYMDQFALEARLILHKALQEALPLTAGALHPDSGVELVPIEEGVIDALADLLCERYREDDEDLS